jgi:hypothetical protein
VKKKNKKTIETTTKIKPKTKSGNSRNEPADKKSCETAMDKMPSIPNGRAINP